MERAKTSAVSTTLVKTEITTPPLRTKACTWLKTSTQQIITAAIAVGSMRMKSTAPVNLSMPQCPDMPRKANAAYPVTAVRPTAATVRRRVRTPISGTY